MDCGCSYSRSFLFVFMVSVASGIGCQRTDVFPVKGKLMIGGQPAGGASIVFHAVDKRILSRAVATSAPDGTFCLRTHAVDDGAAAGDHVVTLFWRDESMPDDNCTGTDLVKHDLLRGKYLFFHLSPLRATVRRGSNDIIIQADAPTGDAKKKSISTPFARAGDVTNGWGNEE